MYLFYFSSIMEINPKIDKTWLEVLENEFKKPYFKDIKQTIINDLKNGEVLYPPMNLIFNAFNQTPFDKVKVVILWQDPYHWEWQAHWLCFSVQEWVTPPPSLKNIFKEIENNTLYNPSEIINWQLKWDLTKWTKQWVLLLNAILTVKAWKPASHSKIWWETFTDEVIRTISNRKEWIIFLLWWNFAKSKKSLIDTNKHYILEATHPSPFSAHNWFFWCKHFSKTNEILKKLGKEEIDWKI